MGRLSARTERDINKSLIVAPDEKQPPAFDPIMRGLDVTPSIDACFQLEVIKRRCFTSVVNTNITAIPSLLQEHLHCPIILR